MNELLVHRHRRGLKHRARKDVPYALGHAAISLWIKSGMDPVEAAYRAGRSLAVLYRG